MAPRARPGKPKRQDAILAERMPLEIRSEADFTRWFEPFRWGLQIAVQRVFDDTARALSRERKRVIADEGTARRVWRILGHETSSLLKTPRSIRSKLARELAEREDAGKLPDGRLSIEQVQRLLARFPDLGRFRVVGDFAGDVQRALDTLLPRPRRRMLCRYRCPGPFKDYVYDLGLRKPTQGHRARQFTVEVVENGTSYLVEIQLMTRLQHAWDRRNHPVYEWVREGEHASSAAPGQRHRTRRDAPPGR